MKTCNICDLAKDIAEFKKTKTGYKATCRLCCYEYDLKWRAKNPDRYKDGQLKAKYGISIDDYNELLIKQNYSCAICDKNQSEFKQKFAVDHCHKTLKVRGLLCGACNKAIGYLRDNPQLAESVAQYLRSSHAF